MKERPILMTPENAQKCFEGVKTQTRRMNGLEEINENPSSWACTVLERGEAVFVLRPYSPRGHRQIKCFYGVPGDRLWIREAWCVGKPALPSGAGIIPWYGPIKTIDQNVCTKVVHRGAWGEDDQPKWRSGMFMPRWACRTVVEITEIRVQRVQEIGQGDACAEGCPPVHEPIGWYAELWDSINGKGAWDANPFVWVITFKKAQRKEAV